MIKLKYLSVLIGILALITSCNNIPENTFELKGEVKNYNAEIIFITYVTDLEERIKDSCIVKNNKFIFKGNIKEPTKVILSNMDYNQMYNPDFKSYVIYLEPTKMYFKADWSLQSDNPDKTSPYELVGSTTNNESQILENIATDMPLESYIDNVKCFIAKYPNSYISTEILEFLSSRISLEDLKTLCNGLGEKAKSYSTYDKIQDIIKTLQAIQPGEPAPDFTRTDLNGKTFKLSDYKGKVILLDFWASWCKPCREGMPHIKELYKKYKNKNFVVICISDNDSELDAWKKAIETDGTSDFIHTLRGLKTLKNGSFDRSDDLCEFYAVHSIPSKFIINTDGVFAGVKMENNELDAKLIELFGF